MTDLFIIIECFGIECKINKACLTLIGTYSIIQAIIFKIRKTNSQAANFALIWQKGKSNGVSDFKISKGQESP